EKTAKAIVLFNVKDFSPQMKTMADTVVECADLVREAVPLLRSITDEAGRLSAITEQISVLEGRADEMHDAGLKALYEECATQPMRFFVCNEIFDHLENVVDRFDDVGNEIQGIVIDHV